MSGTALIVFAKAPWPGQVKTRLVPALGEAGAAALAARLLQRAVQAAAGAALGPLELCVAPDGAHPLLQALAATHGAALQPQGDGDLGARMHRALVRALQRHGRALLFGTDVPALDAAVLTAAAQALDTHDAVFVPALDGGYALVGLKAPQPALFEAMTWSVPSVMDQTRARARAAGLRWAELPALADIDEPSDLRHLPPGWRAEAP
ncbi:MAG: TIGR04282 family arsenosugar biosynthesis glycosyltransferase [Rubrivivax sp.]